MLEGSRIILVSDDEVIARYLKDKLTSEGGYIVKLEYVPKAGIDAFKSENYDIAIIKYDMPEADAFVKEIKKLDPDCPIIALIERDNTDTLKDIIRLGIYDVLPKPVDLDKLFFLVKKGIELHLLLITHRKLTQSLQEQNISLQRQNALLAKRVEESTKNLARLYEDLRTTYMRTIKVLAQAIDARDHYTHSHSENVAKYAVAIAREMSFSAKDIEHLREACELHDLGKIGVEDNILGKADGLTPQEWEQIKQHPITAAQILEPLTFLGDVTDLVKQHHERYDGKGYPKGLKGEEILLGARILHLADAYDSMRSARSYRKIPLSKEETMREIKKNTGTQFDPKVVEAFFRIADHF